MPVKEIASILSESMPEKDIASTLSTVALISLIISGLMYIFSVMSVVKRLKSHKKKSSGTGILCVILATLFAVIAFQLYIGFSLWFIIGIIIVDSVFVMLLTE